jgi:endogenous inhibitor of DNA gyrase (YacG/DUF329 family)
LDDCFGAMGKAVQCPTCKRTGDWLAGAFGPFCSHRCRLIDLGKWLGEEHRISDPLRSEHLEKYAELPPGEHLDGTGATDDED